MFLITSVDIYICSYIVFKVNRRISDIIIICIINNHHHIRMMKKILNITRRSSRRIEKRRSKVTAQPMPNKLTSACTHLCHEIGTVKMF